MDISEILRPILFPFAKQFIAGEKLEDALRVVKRLNQEGKSATINLLGEHISDKKEISRTVDEYLNILRAIHQNNIRSDISLKLTQLGLGVSDDLCLSYLNVILKQASRLGNQIEIDMESSLYTSRTIDIFLKVLANHPNTRLAFQAKLFRSSDDFERLMAAGARIRLCKGAYKETSSICETRPSLIKEKFSYFMSKLLERNSSFPAIATHDKGLIDECKKLFGSRKKDFEFQMLYGIASSLQKDLVQDGYNVRVYIPYGKDWLSYFLRRLDREFLIRLIKMKLKR